MDLNIINCKLKFFNNLFHFRKLISLIVFTFPILWSEQSFSNSSSLSLLDSSLIHAYQPHSLLNNPQFLPTQPLVNTNKISSFFGKRQDPFTGLMQDHHGVDYPAKMGTPILVSANGFVKQAGYLKGYGNFVEIDHGEGFSSKYAHASEILVHVGQEVKKGKIIALVGNTGHSTGPHLHFEISQFGQALNPLNIISDSLQIGEIHQSNKYSIIKNHNRNNNPFVEQKNIKPYFISGEMIVAIKVRSGKSVKW